MRKAATRTGVVIMAVAICVWAAWEVRVRAYHNFASVENGRVYRSSQMSGEDLRKTAKDLKIRSVINLRGAHPGSKWYDDEISVSDAIGIKHYDIKWNATRLPPPDELKRLLKVYDEAPYPILIHCMSGADRTGLASALYLIAKKGEDVKTATCQLDWKLGHLPLGRTRAMDSLIALYKEHGDGLPVHQWADEKYARLYADRKLAARSVGSE